MIETAVMMGPVPILTSFLKENSSPKANIKKIIPMSAHVWILEYPSPMGKASYADRLKSRPRYNPKISGCRRRLKIRPVMPAMTRMSAKSDIIFISKDRKGSTGAAYSAGTLWKKLAYS